MRLELGHIFIKDIQFVTAVKDGILYVNKDELIKLVRKMITFQG